MFARRYVELPVELATLKTSAWGHAVLLGILLLVLLGALIGMLMLRSVRKMAAGREPAKRVEQDAELDPWLEAGRRIKTPEEGKERDGERSI